MALALVSAACSSTATPTPAPATVAPATVAPATAVPATPTAAPTVDLTAGGILSQKNLGLTYSLTQRALLGGPDGPTTPAAGTTPGGCTKMYSAWYINPITTSAPWVRSTDLFKAAGPLLCYTPTVVGPASIDIPTQVSMIETAIAAKPDVIITCTLDASAFKSVLTAARAAGIVVVDIVCGGTDSLGTLYDFEYGYGDQDRGTKACAELTKMTNGNGNVLAVETSPTMPTQNSDLKYMEQACQGTNVKVTKVEYDNSDAGQGAQEVDAALSADPSINAIWTVEGGLPGAIPGALQSAGKKPGDIHVLASDLVPGTCQAIANGWIDETMYYTFFDSSVIAMRLALDKVQGVYTPTKDGIEKGNGPIIIVNKDNLPPEICGAATASPS